MGPRRYGNRDIKTPHLDRVTQAARFRKRIHSYPRMLTLPRSAMTSRYPSELGIAEWIDPQKEPVSGSLICHYLARATEGIRLCHDARGSGTSGTRDEFHPTRRASTAFSAFATAAINRSTLGSKLTAG